LSSLDSYYGKHSKSMILSNQMFFETMSLALDNLKIGYLSHSSCKWLSDSTGLKLVLKSAQVSQLSVTVTNTWDNQFMKRKGLLWFIV
jgi:hypothetical protein